jgi:type I restriction enzyme S subunit
MTMGTSTMRKVKLKEVCDRITVGHVGPMADKYTTKGIPFLRSQNITPFRLNVEDIKYVPREFHEKLRKSALQPGDVAVVRTGYPGTACVIPDTFKELNCADLVVITPSGELNPHYLAAIFNSAWGMASVAGNLVGVAQQHFNVGAAKELEVQLPPRTTQDRIAGILSAYDELIENSQRRIKILEVMARALYREWFVHFRFPGHESVRLVASPLGEIPQGWEARKLSEFVTTQYGYTESTNASPIGPKYLRGMDMNKTSYIDWPQVPYCPISVEDKESYAVKKGDVFVIRMADPGKVGIVEQDVDAVFASYLIRVRPTDGVLRPYFLFHLLDSPAYQSYISGASTGTTRKSASAGVITDFQFALPPMELSAEFEARASTFRAMLTTLLKQINNLRLTRDLLLPRLLTGQINVESLREPSADGQNSCLN